jgi:arsenical pump membrane protein
MADVAAVFILAATLLAVTRPPRPWPEVAWTAPAAGLVVLVGLETPHQAWDGVRPLLPTVIFLAAIFVVADVAERAGLFDLAGQRLEQAGRSQWRLLASVALLAVGITTVLSLDATAVLFTPVVIRAVRDRPNRDAPLLATILLANGASTLLPVANLTNLLAFRQLHLSFVGFAERMALPTAVAAVTITLTCSVFGSRSAEPSEVQAFHRAEPTAPDRTARLVMLGIVALLVAFFVGSSLGAEPAWMAVAGAVILGGVAIRRLDTRPSHLLAAISPAFLGFVICLAVVVDTARRHGLANVVDHLPSGHGLAALLGLAAVAAVLANVVNNLPATLILLPALSGRAKGLMLAMLLGVNIGPNLTYTGSLATLLWRKVVRAERVEPSVGSFYRISAVATPLALVGAVVALWLTLHLVR